MAVTLKDIAEKVGVTESTVSRVLNGIPKASEKTQKKIFKVAAELGYNPNQIARSLVTKETKTIGLIISDLANTYFARVASGIEKIASKYGYSLVISTTGGQENAELKYINLLQEKRVDGLLFASGKMPVSCRKLLIKSEIPTVVVAREVAEELPSVHIDNVKESYRAVEYLIKAGHTKIAMISGSAVDKESGAYRIQGYKKALNDNNLEIKEDLIVEGNFKLASGIRAMNKLLQINKNITAVFAASDEMGVGAIKAIKKAGLKVPHDISVIGFDNNIISLASEPELTTISQPEEKLGQQAMEMLYKVIKEQPLTAHKIYLPCQLIKRNSVQSII
ncbi:LacI family DNA-binding transcriptional regulator [Halanaerobium salsuginis]|jgi:LacI family transcriptional regulator|uniref:Transcriptional regulator, LacI family n=1 Tax=Halanaerobium salsuginis TaxID=29563 RepID=A0A1I4IH57_9FIRM|nr:LacI family DNA-binding transcriptional regulator [Halanaerobium salsuginis]SFL53702.1 transcriptional regulator, LacI family [Halanaerobium salsuginis]